MDRKEAMAYYAKVIDEKNLVFIEAESVFKKRWLVLSISDLKFDYHVDFFENINLSISTTRKSCNVVNLKCDDMGEYFSNGGMNSIVNVLDRVKVINSLEALFYFFKNEKIFDEDFISMFDKYGIIATNEKIKFKNKEKADDFIKYLNSLVVMYTLL